MHEPAWVIFPRLRPLPPTCIFGGPQLILYSQQPEQNPGAGMNFPSLFSPVKIGPYRSDHLVMAPLTRMRAEKPSLCAAAAERRILCPARDAGRADHRRSLAGGGAPVSAVPACPASTPSSRLPDGARWSMPFMPGAGIIFLQLWHVGRVSHSSFQPGGALPVAPSAVADLDRVQGDDGRRARSVDYETPRALETSEIPP